MRDMCPVTLPNLVGTDIRAPQSSPAVHGVLSLILSDLA